MDKEITEQIKKIEQESEQKFQKLTKPIYDLKEEIGEDKWNELVSEACSEADEELKEKIGEDKWEIYLAASGNNKLKERIINKIGQEEYNILRDEVNKILLDSSK